MRRLLGDGHDLERLMRTHRWRGALAFGALLTVVLWLGGGFDPLLSAAIALAVGVLFRLAGEVERLWVAVPKGEINVGAAVVQLVIAALLLSLVWRIALTGFGVD